MHRILIVAIFLVAPLHSLAQQPEMRWFGPTKVSGPVRSIRVEKTIFENQNGKLVEGPRVLVQTAAYNEDGTRVKLTNYQPNGLVALRTIEQFDKAGGHILERATFDSQGKLFQRTAWLYDDQKRWSAITIYDDNGSIRGKTTFTYDDGFRYQTTENYDRTGQIIGRVTGKLDMRTHRAEQISQNKQETSQRTSAFTDTPGGQTYEATLNGQQTDKIVSTKTAAGGQVTEYNNDNSVKSRRRSEAKADSHGNPIEITWFEQGPSGDFNPTNILYWTFTYYEKQ